MWFIGVEVEQETSAPPPKKNPGSAPDIPAELMVLLESINSILPTVSCRENIPTSRGAKNSLVLLKVNNVLKKIE